MISVQTDLRYRNSQLNELILHAFCPCISQCRIVLAALQVDRSHHLYRHIPVLLQSFCQCAQDGRSNIHALKEQGLNYTRVRSKIDFRDEWNVNLIVSGSSHFDGIRCGQHSFGNRNNFIPSYIVFLLEFQYTRIRVDDHINKVQTILLCCPRYLKCRILSNVERGNLHIQQNTL